MSECDLTDDEWVMLWIFVNRSRLLQPGAIRNKLVRLENKIVSICDNNKERRTNEDDDMAGN